MIRGYQGVWILLVLSLSSVGLACGADESEGVDESGTTEAEASAEEATEEVEPTRPRARPFLPVSMQRSTRAESFPHPKHVTISCAVCHEGPAGHTSHGQLECSECHRGSAEVTQMDVPRSECLACHHGPLQEAGCEDCHGSPGVRSPTESLRFTVWPAPRPRVLGFDHALHESRDCATCHRAQPSLTPDVACASCHEDHHRPEAVCATCHQAPPADAHDLDSHLTCGGSGCHQVEGLEELQVSRSGCLVCHEAQLEHEAGKPCAECHQVRPGRQPEADDRYLHAPAFGAAGGRHP